MGGRQLQELADPARLARGEAGCAFRQIRRLECGRCAVGEAELGHRPRDVVVDVPAAAAEELRLEAVLTEPGCLATDALGMLRAGCRRSGMRRRDEVRVE